MELAFTIDALSASGQRAWRLLADETTWRQARFGEPASSKDALLDMAKAALWHGRWLRRDKKHGLAPIGRLGPFAIFVRGAFAHAIVHRFSAAPIPSLAQMRRELAELTPGTPWLLYLDLGGAFRALDTRKEPIQGNLRIAVRGEIASSEAFVGPEAAADEAATALLYRQFLAGWLEHLQTGQTHRFIPEPEDTPPLDALRAALEAWRPEERPR